MRIAVLGAGYVGLVTAACLAELGHRVTCVDIDPAKIEALRAGRVPIYEPGLDQFIAQNCAGGRLDFAMVNPQDAEVVFLAVGTPPQLDGAGADLQYLFAAAETVARTAGQATTLVIKSTVPPGSADALERVFLKLRPDIEFDIVSNPEFLREGNGIADFLCPDRIVCGAQTPSARRVMSHLYRPLVERGSTILFTGRRAAELIKHASNAFLSIKISFINEVADLCEAVGASIDEVSAGIGLDRRIGSAFLKAGPGYGGSCFPKDAAALVATARANGVRMRSVETAAMANEARQAAMAQRIVDALGGSAEGRTVAVLGLAFKADTDDARESPAISIIHALLRQGAIVRAYDPQAMPQARLLLEAVAFAETPYACVEGADCVAVLTEWQEFRDLDISRLARATETRVILDMRNLLEARLWTEQGFSVHGIGRQIAVPGHASQSRVAAVGRSNRAEYPMQGIA